MADIMSRIKNIKESFKHNVVEPFREGLHSGSLGLVGTKPATGKLTLDTAKEVYFYEQDFYPLSNFSAFRVEWRGRNFDTSELAYHWEKFNWDNISASQVQYELIATKSAHDAFKLAQEYKEMANPEWDKVKYERMYEILKCKVEQHPYVLKKLLVTGTRNLVENSWRDSDWGWGEDRQGQNNLGKIWMRIRQEYFDTLVFRAVKE